MRNRLLLFWALLPFSTLFSQYQSDQLGANFAKYTIRMPNDYEGKVVCTLVKCLTVNPSSKAILYVHGYNDYFFQTEMAARFTKAGYRFYAVDLRKYGRSLLKNQYHANVQNLNEYFADIDTSIATIRKEGARSVILIGHSTGGLITTLYASQKKSESKIDGLILNSPFFDFYESSFNEKVTIPVISWASRYLKNVEMKTDSNASYGKSIHIDYHGEWLFDKHLKSIYGLNKRLSWIGAIRRAHKEVQKGLDIKCPILVMSSDRSIKATKWSVDCQTKDVVLDVNDIQTFSKNIGKRCKRVVVPGGMHDLVLSKKSVREAVYRTMLKWMNEQ